MDIKLNDWEAINWIHMAQDRDQWQVPVNMIMNL
jgi:hypothetical protein